MWNQLAGRKEYLWVILLLLGFSSPIFYAVWKYGVDVPYWDQWEYVRFFRSFENGTLSISDLFSLHNEYRQLVPNILFLSLGLLTKWRVQLEMTLTILMVAGIGWMMLAPLLKEVRIPFWVRLIIFCFVSVVLFTPAQYENWLFGVQFVYFFPIFCLLLCIRISTFSWRRSTRWLVIAMISFLSTLSSVNGFLCWLSILPLFLQSEFLTWKFYGRFLIATVALVVSAMLLYISEYSQPGNLPTLLQSKQTPGHILDFFLRLTGNALGHNLTCNSENIWFNSVQGGLIVLVLGCFSIWSIYRARNVPFRIFSMPWLLPGIYGLVTALMVTFGRSNLGIEQACAPRYIGFTLFAATGALILPVLYYFLCNRSVLSRVFAGLSITWMICAIMLKVHQYSVDFNFVKMYGANQARAKCGLLLSNFIPFTEHQTLIYPSDFEKLQKKAAWLSRNGYIRPAIRQSPYLQFTETDTLKQCGVFTNVTMTVDSILAQGTIADTGLLPLRQVIVLTTLSASGKPEIVGMDNGGSLRWKIRIPKERIKSQNGLLEAWLFDSHTGLFHKIQGKHRIEI